jgi:hypothetical protein
MPGDAGRKEVQVGRDFGFALCAALASLLAVLYTLLHLEWTDPAAAAAVAPAAEAHAASGQR